MIVKICGITRAVDARHALDSGADWIGLNLFAGPRRVSVERAIDLIGQLSSSSPVVALLDAREAVSRGPLVARLHALGVGRLQLYGSVNPTAVHEAKSMGFQVIHVQAVSGAGSIESLEAFLNRCGSDRPDFVLFDAAAPPGGSAGGTGRRVDARIIREARREGRFAAWPPILLAGGLTPDNVAEAVAEVRPDGVDVSSGVEQLPGVKDPVKVSAFIAAAKRTESA